MAVAPVVVRKRGGARRVRAHVFSLSQVRRAGNRERFHRALELRCECARAGCTSKVPLVAEAHRGTGDRFVVAPAHVGHAVVVRAADNFFVTEAQ